MAPFNLHIISPAAADNMALEDKDRLDLRKYFEVLLTDAMKSIARAKPDNGERPMPEFPKTFREGVKWGFIVVGLINKSTTELNDKQLRMLCERMHTLLNIPPPPDFPN